MTILPTNNSQVQLYPNFQRPSPQCIGLKPQLPSPWQQCPSTPAPEQNMNPLQQVIGIFQNLIQSLMQMIGQVLGALTGQNAQSGASGTSQSPFGDIFKPMSDATSAQGAQTDPGLQDNKKGWGDLGKKILGGVVGAFTGSSWISGLVGVGKSLLGKIF